MKSWGTRSFFANVLIAVFFGHPPEMVTHCSEGQTVGKVAGVMSENLIEIRPELAPCPIAYAEPDHDAEQRPYVLPEC